MIQINKQLHGILIRRCAGLVVFLLAVSGAAATAPALAADTPVIAAASSLNGALEEISRGFTRSTNERVRISFGSSGNLTRQIIQGAPFELFLSADEGYTNTLESKGLVDGNSEVYAVGRLALLIPDGSSLAADRSFENLARALTDGRVRRLAIANPEHAPYGRAAREVLEYHHLWQAAQGNLLLGENVAQAAQFAGSGDVDAGIVSASIAQEPALADKGSHVILPDAWHTPLEHHMVLLGDAGSVAHAFRSYLHDEAANAIFQKFGFSTPAHTQ